MSDEPKEEAKKRVLAVTEELLIGTIGRSTSAIDKGEKGYCHFPVGPPDLRYRGGRVWRRTKAKAEANIRPFVDVIVTNENRGIREHTVESPLINEEKIIINADNIDATTTENTEPFETTGYNKVTGHIFADQNITVYVDQSSDKTNWDVVTTAVNYIANSTGGGFSVEIVSPFARVRFKNATATATKTCRKSVRLSAGA